MKKTSAVGALAKQERDDLLLLLWILTTNMSDLLMKIVTAYRIAALRVPTLITYWHINGLTVIQ